MHDIVDKNTGQSIHVKPEGSLGLLALGYEGLMAWRAAKGIKMPVSKAVHKKKTKSKLLLIGWDAADWKIIHPLMDAGKMPALESLVNRGVMGNLATLDPPLSPMLWTSIATGKTADKHGIYGFIESAPDHNAVRPVNVTSRKVKAVWNILQHEGLKSNVVSWWPSHPAEPLKGVTVSNFFQQAKNNYGQKWPLTKGSIHPVSLNQTIKKMRVHPGELTQAHLLPFVPKAAKIDQEKDKRLAMLARIIASAASTQAASTWLMDNTDWDFMAVYFDTIDHFCHGFMKFHPPMLPGMDKELFELYKGVVEGAYIFQDMMLDRMIKLAGDDCSVMIISDHGFHADHLRPLALPKLPAAPALEHRPYGIFVAAGPGIKKDETIYGASLLDITPTILNLFGLAAANDMDGKVLTGIFENTPVTERIESWENKEGDFGEHPDHLQQSEYDSQEAMQQLIDLGYIDKPDKDKTKAVEKATDEAHYNLARVYLSKNNLKQAKELLDALFLKNKEDIRYLLDLAMIGIRTDDLSNAQKYIDAARKTGFKNLLQLDILSGLILLKQQKPQKALAIFKKVEQANPAHPVVNIELGNIYLQSNRHEAAKKAFEKALSLDDGNPQAWHGLGVALLRLGKYTEAADSLLNSIGLMYHFPPAHYHLGEALYHSGRKEEAKKAFALARALSPRLVQAKQWEDKIDQQELPVAREPFPEIKSREKTVFIVSGLPRSGTSLMMQMLLAGGIQPYCDETRLADEHNPKGYFESENVKMMRKNNAFLKEAKGKAVKVIAQLLPFLPSELNYRIIFMERDMFEIIQSQQKMLGKNPDVFPVSVAESYQKSLEKTEVWRKKMPNVEMLYVNYNKLVQNPAAIVGDICKFTGLKQMEAQMIDTIDTQLYRTKK